MTPRQALGIDLGIKRISKRLSQAEVGHRLGFKNGQLVSNWERGVGYPPRATWRPLAKIYGIRFVVLIDMVFAAKRDELEDERREALAG